MLSALIWPLLVTTTVNPSAPPDPRNVANGLVIPDEGYCDQPYVVIRGNGAWVCTMTTGKGKEGQEGQHVVATVSRDQGHTWCPPIDIEQADGPQASWAVPLITPAGRIYVFYDYNGDRIATLDGKPIRADMLGWYVYKYSDDGGLTWSQRRRLPIRTTACDLGNQWKGAVQVMWGIDKPCRFGDSVIFGFTKLGRYILDDGEGWFIRSDNILSEPDPDKIEWKMLPDGDHGVRSATLGSVQEEFNVVPLSDDSLFCVFRTMTGHPGQSYSRDKGHTWAQPIPAVYSPGGRMIKQPRACPQLWRCANGKFLLWYHNHSLPGYKNRNPAWITGGVERDGQIHWSQPEILLYDDDVPTHMSYPDLIEQSGRYWVTETQKELARVHEIDPTLLEGMWNQGTNATATSKGLVLSWVSGSGHTAEPKLPALPDLRTGGGFTIELVLSLENTSPGRILLDSRDSMGRGVLVRTANQNNVRIEMSDGSTIAAWESDADTLQAGRPTHLNAIVESGPRIITFVIDGIVCDGGPQRPFGWGRFSRDLGDVNGRGGVQTSRLLGEPVRSLRVYNRYLRTSEAVANFTAAQKSVPTTRSSQPAN